MTLCQALDDFKMLCPPTTVAFSAMYMFYMGGAIVVSMTNHKNNFPKVPLALNATDRAKTFLESKDENLCLPILIGLHEYLLNFDTANLTLNQQELSVALESCSGLEDMPSLLKFLAKLELLHAVEEAVVDVAEDSHKSFNYICWTNALLAFMKLSEEFGWQLEMTQLECQNETTRLSLCCFVKHESGNLLLHLSEFRKTAEYVKVFHGLTNISYIVNMPVYAVVIGSGLVLNGCLLLMFIKEKDVRSAPNVMIFNLALADILNLCIFGMATMFLFASTVSTEALNLTACRTTLILRDGMFRLTQLSIVAIAGQRYLATVVLMNHWNFDMRITTLKKAAVYVATIWTVSVILTVLALSLSSWEHRSCFFVLGGGLKSTEFALHSLLLPLAVIVFYFLTAERLKRSVREIPGERLRVTQQELGRYRSAQVLTGLSLAYFITYVPYFIADFLMALLGFDIRHMHFIFWLMTIMNGMVIANPMCNTLALYLSSSVFRKLFNQYLFSKCRRNPRIHETGSLLNKLQDSQGTSSKSSEVTHVSSKTIWYLNT